MMTEQDHREHRDFFNWFFRTTKAEIHRQSPAVTYACLRRFGLIRHTGIYREHGVTLIYRKDDSWSCWQNLVSSQSYLAHPALADRQDLWSQNADKMPSLRDDLRELTIFTAMLAWIPPVTEKLP